MTRVQAVLFDLDGTLVDSAPDLAFAAEQMRAARGLQPLPLQCYRPLAGQGMRGMLQAGFGALPGDAGFEGLREEFFSRYQACLLRTTLPFAGVDALVAGLVQRGLPWGVVTNKAARFTEPLVAGLAVFASAGAIVSGDTTPYAKPHPAPLLEAARRLDVAPEHCLYVGDDERDIQAGRAAGMRTVAVHYGYLGQNNPVHAWGAHADVDSPYAVLDLLDDVAWS